MTSARFAASSFRSRRASTARCAARSRCAPAAILQLRDYDPLNAPPSPCPFCKAGAAAGAAAPAAVVERRAAAAVGVAHALGEQRGDAWRGVARPILVGAARQRTGGRRCPASPARRRRRCAGPVPDDAWRRRHAAVGARQCTEWRRWWTSAESHAVATTSGQRVACGRLAGVTATARAADAGRRRCAACRCACRWPAVQQVVRCRRALIMGNAGRLWLGSPSPFHRGVGGGADGSELALGTRALGLAGAGASGALGVRGAAAGRRRAADAAAAGGDLRAVAARRGRQQQWWQCTICTAGAGAQQEVNYAQLPNLGQRDAGRAGESVGRTGRLATAPGERTTISKSELNMNKIETNKVKQKLKI
jgi:hypothetical protein